MTTKRVTVRHLSGKPSQTLIVKRDEAGNQPVYISAPKFFLLDAETAYQLADALVDIVEHRERETTDEA